MKRFIFLLFLSFKAIHTMDEGQLTTTFNRNFTYKLTHTTCDRKLKKNQKVNLFQFLDLEKTSQDCLVLIQFQNFKEALEDEWAPSHPDMKALIALGKGTGILNTDGTLKTTPTVDEEDDFCKNQIIRFLQLMELGRTPQAQEAILSRILSGKTDEEIVHEAHPNSIALSFTQHHYDTHIKALYSLAKVLSTTNKTSIKPKQYEFLADTSRDLLIDSITNKGTLDQTWNELTKILLAAYPTAQPIIKQSGKSFSQYPESFATTTAANILKLIQGLNKKPTSSTSSG